MQVIHIVANATKAKIIEAERDVKLYMSELLSYQVEGAEHTDAFASGSWSGISSFFKMTDMTFPAGFVGFVKASLESVGHKVIVSRKALPPMLGDENPIVDTFPEDSRYDYQAKTIKVFEDKVRMVAQIATGGGKSRIAKMAYKRVGRMTLFLTTRGVLMYQMKKSFEEMGEKVGVIGDGSLAPNRGFNVGMVQTFSALLKNESKRELAKKLLSKFEFIILEEAHEIGADGYYEVLNLCSNAHYRLALTATPFMKENAESNMRLQAAVGGIGITVTEKTLIDRGILAKPYFKFISTDKPRLLYRTTKWQPAYRIGITDNDSRNKAIVFEVERAAKLGLKSMVLVKHKAHGVTLGAMISATGVKCSFIYGEDSQEERERELNNLKTGKISVLIGSTILDVGVDVPAVGMIVLAGGGKEEVALRQRIGRGLREKKDSANVAFIVDFTDEHNNHLRGHSKTRRAIIESTDGFHQGILPSGKDFDFKMLEKK